MYVIPCATSDTRLLIGFTDTAEVLQAEFAAISVAVSMSWPHNLEDCVGLDFYWKFLTSAKAKSGEMSFEPAFSPDGTAVAFVDFADDRAKLIRYDLTRSYRAADTRI